MNQSGAKVQGASGEIELAEYFTSAGNDGGAPQIEIATDGTIRVNGREIDKLEIVNVSDPAQLERKGNAYFTVDDESAITEENLGSLMQGYYEKGNVEPLNEMVDMMKNMQLFESQQRAMRTSDDLLSRVSTQLGKF